MLLKRLDGKASSGFGNWRPLLTDCEVKGQVRKRDDKKQSKVHPEKCLGQHVRLWKPVKGRYRTAVESGS